MANETKGTPAAEPAKGSAPSELSDDQLDKVSGGCFNIGNQIGQMINKTVNTVSSTLAAEAAKNKAK